MKSRLPNPGPQPERVPLGPARWLDVRPPTPADLDAIERFYDGLDPDDRYHRFFTSHHPERDVLRSWIERVPGQGRRLLAVRETGEVVADSGFTLLDDGDAELDLVVARPARGWLGGYLLDRIVTAAQADGVRNLRADVLVDNGPMLALVHHRRFATSGHDDHTVAHLVMAVSGETPRWGRRHDRPRIVIEGGGLGLVPAGTARALDMDVLMCPGPRRHPSCPALRARPCPLIEEADAVVCALTPQQGRDALLDAHRRLHPGTARFRTGDGDGEGDGDAGRATPLGDDRPPLEAVARALGLPAALPRRHAGDPV